MKSNEKKCISLTQMTGMPGICALLFYQPATIYRRCIGSYFRPAKKKRVKIYEKFVKENDVLQEYLSYPSTVEDIKFKGLLAEQAGASLISIVADVYGCQITIPSLYSFRATNVELARQIKEIVKIPVCLTGRIDDVQQADRMFIDEKACLERGG